MIQRRTQTAVYWQEQFEPKAKDISYLYGLILDGGKPASTMDLAQQLITRHCQQEEETIRAELDKGDVYQPQDAYEVGQLIIFPTLDYALGTVVGVRPGRNPDHGDFVVIQVEFEDDGDVREFASQLEGEHSLNRQEGDEELLTAASLLSPGELYEHYAESIERKLVKVLGKQEEFVQVGDEWFLQDLLVKVDLGRRNIAEALIEIRAMPLPASEIVHELDLPAEVPEAIKLLSLNHALSADRRFDNIGDGGRDIWYLQRLTPEPVIDPPKRLVIKEEPYDRQTIAEELLLIEREIDDEGSGEEVMGTSRPLYKTTMTLTYSHWRCGTLPLTVRTRGLFPQSANHHTPVVLVDGQSGEKMQGWIVHQESFVYGLEDWYARYALPVGAMIKLERTRDLRVINVDFEARRLKTLWGKVAVVQGDRLIFQVRKLPIACEYDDQLNIGEDNRDALDRLWARMDARNESLFQIMIRIMPELTKLSPQATVHAKTIYSSVNLLRRTPPGPIFALLSTKPCFISMGGGYWTFDEALVRS